MGHLKTPIRIAITLVFVLALARWGIPYFFGKGHTSLSAAQQPVSVSTVLGVGGHPNKSQDVQQWASRTMQFVGAQTCAQCHQEKSTLWSASPHVAVSCEDCHGAARDHVQQGAKPVINTTPALCARCHDQVAGRPASFPQVAIDTHGGGAKCIDCHNPHSPRFQVATQAEKASQVSGAAALPAADAPPGEAAPPQIPHRLQGRSDCVACHEPGGSAPTYPANHAGRESGVCQLCHKAR